MDFKLKALETFTNNIKTKIPDVTEHDLEMMQLSFMSGFHVGIAQDKTEFEQQIALTLLSI
jgi:hypothetical protein